MSGKGTTGRNRGPLSSPAIVHRKEKESGRRERATRAEHESSVSIVHRYRRPLAHRHPAKRTELDPAVPGGRRKSKQPRPSISLRRRTAGSISSLCAPGPSGEKHHADGANERGAFLAGGDEGQDGIRLEIPRRKSPLPPRPRPRPRSRKPRRNRVRGRRTRTITVHRTDFFSGIDLKRLTPLAYDADVCTSLLLISCRGQRHSRPVAQLDRAQDS
jgi:hypothetical protein